MNRAYRAIAGLLIAVAGLAGSPAAFAQDYPTKPVKIVVGFAPGGVADITARIVAQKLSERLKQQFLVENRPSAGGIIAAEAVAKAPPDGYTLLLISNGNAVSVSLFKKLNYDPVKDFAMVSEIGYFGLAVVTSNESKLKTVKDVIATAKANPESSRSEPSGSGARSTCPRSCSNRSRGSTSRSCRSRDRPKS